MHDETVGYVTLHTCLEAGAGFFPWAEVQQTQGVGYRRAGGLGLGATLSNN